MKHKYVVDLNIARRAQTLTDVGGQFSKVSARVLTELLGRCHSIVLCTEILAGYSDLADELEDSGAAQGPSIFGLAAATWTVDGKWLRVPPPPAVHGEDDVKDDERVLVRLAVAHAAHIITEDGPLREAITESQVLQAQGVSVLSVAEGLQHILDADDP